MVFSSMTFLWVFLPLLLITYFLTKDRFKNYILLCFSLVFYAWGEPKYIFLMIASVVVNYSFGRLIDKLPDGGRRRFTLICSIIFNLGLL
ncbi:MAG: MBOAT family protein, partial [Oscillospiraceae bacterium]|nr:MBOAT family protein [Oscillospiraceae bacterium]